MFFFPVQIYPLILLDLLIRLLDVLKAHHYKQFFYRTQVPRLLSCLVSQSVTQHTVQKVPKLTLFFESTNFTLWVCFASQFSVRQYTTGSKSRSWLIGLKNSI